MNSVKNEKLSPLSVIGFIGFILYSIALFQSIRTTTDSLFTSAVIYAIVTLIAFTLWGGAFSFLGQIPVINVGWVLIGIAALYAFPIFVWFS